MQIQTAAMKQAGVDIRRLRPLPQRTFVTNGVVRTMAEAAGNVYLAGEFSYVGQRSGPLVGLSVVDGARDKRIPELSGGSVHVILPDSTGGIYVGGDSQP